MDELETHTAGNICTVRQTSMLLTALHLISIKCNLLKHLSIQAWMNCGIFT